MADYGLLNPDHTVRIVGLDEWAAVFVNADRVVKRTEIGEHLISTVFLGVNLGYGDEARWFETMTFGEIFYQTRSATWEESLAEHEKAVAYVMTWDARLRHGYRGDTARG